MYTGGDELLASDNSDDAGEMEERVRRRSRVGVGVLVVVGGSMEDLRDRLVGRSVVDESEGEREDRVRRMEGRVTGERERESERGR